MGDKPTFDLLHYAIVALIPFAVLLFLVLFWWRGRRHRRGALPDLPNEGGGTLHAFDQELARADRASLQSAPQEPIESSDVITRKIEAANASGDNRSLSHLYLKLAASHAREGNADARMSALRSAAGCGALHGPPSAHAAARIALGEAAQESGDLTSACEQWQLAKTAYLESGDADQHARIEKRMRDNGCPTDWVLTDF
jgi:hypothetical protein